MKKYLFLLPLLCLFTIACEQENITPEWTDQNYELIDRGLSCDLTQIPLYILAPESVLGAAINFENTFAVTKSTDYESANAVNINIEQITYKVDGSPSGSQIAYQGNDNYELSVDVTYTINGTSRQENFSLCYRIEGHRLTWGCTNYCEYENTDAIDFRTIEGLISTSLDFFQN